MNSYWQVWLHRTDHNGLIWATVFFAVFGIFTGSPWWAFPWGLVAVLDALRAWARMRALRRLAGEGTPMDTSPFTQAGKE